MEIRPMRASFLMGKEEEQKEGQRNMMKLFIVILRTR